MAAWRDEDCALPCVDDDVLTPLEVDDDVVVLGEAVDIMPPVLLEEMLDIKFCVVVVCPVLWVVDED